jgi:hypothetical protein
MTTTIRAVAALIALGASGLLLVGCGATPAPAGNSPASGSFTSAAAATGADTGSATDGSDGGSDANAQYDPSSVRFENLMADCMKKAGFQYVPAPLPITPPVNSLGAKDPALVPYDQLKTFRSKYGFGGLYAQDVYPGDPNVVPKQLPDRVNPNNTIRSALSPAQQQAYDNAYDGGYIRKITAAGTKTGIKTGGCAASVSAQVYRPGHSAVTDDAAASAKATQAEQAFTTDPTVVSDAQSYGTCLRQKGYTVPSTKPGVIEDTVSSVVQQEHTNNPDPNKRQGLDNEIKKALDDLECGKAYEAAARPFVENLLQNGVG